MTLERYELGKSLELGQSIVKVDYLPEFLDVPTFRKIGKIPDRYVVSCLAASLVESFNPYIEPEEGYIVSTREADFLEIAKNGEEAVDAIGEMGDRQYKSWEAMHGQDWVGRARSVVRSGQIARSGPQREIDIEILREIDIALGNQSRRLNAALTKEGEEFRQGTYQRVEKGELRYSQKGDRIERTIIVPKDDRRLGIVRQRLSEIYPRLSPTRRSGYELIARTFTKFGDAALRTGIYPAIFSP